MKDVNAMHLGRPILHCTIVLTLLLAQTAAAQVRTFTDRTGKYRLRAELESFDGEFVVLRPSDGSQKKQIRFDQLSKADQQFITEKFPFGDISSDLANLVPRTVKIGDDLSPEHRELANRAQKILKDNCYRCHGESGADEGGFGFVLDRTRLVDGEQYISPGKPHSSYLFERVEAGEMPEPGEEPQPSKEDVETLRKWIEAGAPDFRPATERPYIYFQQMEALIKKDLAKVPVREQRYQRYFTLTHLHNAGVTDQELADYRMALSKLINSLSWNPEVAIPTAIDAHQTVLRVDLRNLSWGTEIWEEVLSRYPYGYLTRKDDVKLFEMATQTKLPFVRADWFVAIASRPPLYHDILQVPDTVGELEVMLRVDSATNIANEKVVRAGFNRSGVSQHNRLIERHETPYGYYWKSYDFGGSAGRQNLFQYPLGPGDDESDFLHDGGEMIFSLPNGFHGYMLTDAEGNRLDAGPTQIVSDPNRPDRMVVNGISCMSCHAAGMIAKADEIRGHVTVNQRAFPRADEILALYPENYELEGIFARDARVFQEAMRKIGLGDLERSNEPISKMARQFEDELDLNLACSELGIPEELFRRQLESDQEMARAVGQLTVRGGSMKRDTFVQIFVTVIERFELGVVVSDSDIDNSFSTTFTPPAKDDGELAGIIGKISSGDTSQIWHGFIELGRLKSPQKTRTLTKAIIDVAKNGPDNRRSQAYEALARIDPNGSRDVILEGLNDTNSWVRSSVFTLLKKMKDPKTAEKVAVQLSGSDQSRAIDVLIAIGVPAEEYLHAPLANGSSWITRKKVAEALGRIGTEKSLAALRKSLRDERWVADAARAAIDQINAREGEKFR